MPVTLSLSVYVPESNLKPGRAHHSRSLDNSATPHRIAKTQQHVLSARAASGSEADTIVVGKNKKPSRYRFLKDDTADVIIPLSTRQSNDSSLFSVGGSDGSTPTAMSSGVTSVTVPVNAYSALVEVYASGTAQEEFWYTSIPDETYDTISPSIAANLGLFPRGPFREVQLLVDGKLAGFALPYATIFTGGINPLMWRPQASHGAWDQYTYYVDLTPFLGGLTDGKAHDLQLRVVSAEKNGTIDASWFVSGNVQVKLDQSKKRTTGNIIRYQVQELPAYSFQTKSSVNGDVSGNGTFNATVQSRYPRTLAIDATVKAGSEIIPRLVTWSQSYTYSNVDQSGPTFQYINQTASGQSISTHQGIPFLSNKYSFPLNVGQIVSQDFLNTTVYHEYNQQMGVSDSKYWLPKSMTIKNVQQAEANSIIVNNQIQNGTGSTSSQ